MQGQAANRGSVSRCAAQRGCRAVFTPQNQVTSPPRSHEKVFKVEWRKKQLTFKTHLHSRGFSAFDDRDRLPGVYPVLTDGVTVQIPYWLHWRDNPTQELEKKKTGSSAEPVKRREIMINDPALP